MNFSVVEGLCVFSECRHLFGAGGNISYWKHGISLEQQQEETVSSMLQRPLQASPIDIEPYVSRFGYLFC